MDRLVRIATLACALVAWNSGARAESYNPNSVPDRGPPLIELGASAFARYDHGHFCDVDDDVVACTTGRGFVGGALVPRLRLLPLLSVGALGAYAFSPSSEGTASSDGSHEERSITTYWFAAEVRLHPLYQEGIHLWLAIDVGVTALGDTWQSYDSNDRLISTESNTHVGPVAGLGAGIDFHVLPFLALGPELRAAVLKYQGDCPDTLKCSQGLSFNDAPHYFFTLGVSGTFLVRP